jgi:hypothetical protein
MAVGIWTGRNEGGHLTALTSTGNQKVITDVQQYAHTELFAKDGSWKAGDWFARPAGVQTLSVNGKTDIFPSWYTKPKNADGEQIVFDQVSKKKATSCTPDRAKTTITLQPVTDPVTNAKTYTDTQGYDPNSDDDAHHCDDAHPFATVNVTGAPSKTVVINVTVNQGTFPLSSVSIAVDGQEISNQGVSSSEALAPINYTFSSSGNHTVTATVIDSGMYDFTASTSKTIAVIQPDPLLPGRRREQG